MVTLLFFGKKRFVGHPWVKSWLPAPNLTTECRSARSDAEIPVEREGATAEFVRGAVIGDLG